MDALDKLAGAIGRLTVATEVALADVRNAHLVAQDTHAVLWRALEASAQLGHGVPDPDAPRGGSHASTGLLGAATPGLEDLFGRIRRLEDRVQAGEKRHADLVERFVKTLGGES